MLVITSVWKGLHINSDEAKTERLNEFNDEYSKYILKYETKSTRKNIVSRE